MSSGSNEDAQEPVSLEHERDSHEFGIYLDEGGNTGINFLDPSQPVHTLAGWIVPSELAGQARQLVVARRDEMSMKELKGTQLLRSARGRDNLWRLLDGLLSLGVSPVYSVVEKKYAVAGKIVETFVDPPYNDRITDGFTYQIKAKQGGCPDSRGT